jgi:hypothetical protein
MSFGNAAELPTSYTSLHSQGVKAFYNYMPDQEKVRFPLYLEQQFNLFRLYVPPGVRLVSIELYVPRDASMATVSHFGTPPECTTSCKTYDTISPVIVPTLDELNTHEAFSSNFGGHITVVSASTTSFQTSDLKGRWLYVKLLRYGTGSVGLTQVAVDVNVAELKAWYASMTDADWACIDDVNSSALCNGITPTTRIIGLTGSGLAFGNILLGSSSTGTMTISNTGTSPLTVNSITYPTGFSGNWSGTIPAGSSQNVTVTFTPTVAQQYSGTITVNSDGTGTNTITVSGTGGGTPNVMISGYVRDSGSNGIYGALLTFSNNGGTATTDVNGYYSKSVSSGWSGTVTPSISGYAFSPSSRSYSNLTSNQTYQDYTGTIFDRVISLSGNMSFGNVVVGSTGTAILTISSTGSSALTVNSISYPNGFSGNWSSGTIAAGSSQSITVSFTPTAAQVYSGTIAVNSNKSSGTNTVSASGTGIVGYTISGYVRDSNSYGISGVTLTSSTGATCYTNSSGFYSIAVTSGWNGTLTPSGGYTFMPSSIPYTSGVFSNQTNQNYTATGTNCTSTPWICWSSNKICMEGTCVDPATLQSPVYWRPGYADSDVIDFGDASVKKGIVVPNAFSVSSVTAKIGTGSTMIVEPQVKFSNLPAGIYDFFALLVHKDKLTNATYSYIAVKERLFDTVFIDYKPGDRVRSYATRQVTNNTIMFDVFNDLGGLNLTPQGCADNDYNFYVGIAPANEIGGWDSINDKPSVNNFSNLRGVMIYITP